MRILAVISGEYGQRNVSNIRRHTPARWKVEVWQAPSELPLIINAPADYVPPTLPPADLLLSFGEQRGIAELLPEVTRVTGARVVIAPVDNEAWLPRSLAGQLRDRLQELGIICITPKPLCSLTRRYYATGRGRFIEYNDPLIAEFARYFGQPKLRLGADVGEQRISVAEVVRDTVCGCARYVAQGLVDVSLEEAEQVAGLLHDNYPCLAGMDLDADYGDTLLHVSSNFIKDNVGEQVRPFKRNRTSRVRTRDK
ncbi:MAG: hypothetical protein HS126_33515 [Anaerolineales bacterium]|nr:hypothetical protein [Anaerolineales bacterium]